MKYVLVTGAFGGMGRSVTEQLSKSGYTVFALDKKTEDTHSDNIIPVETDVTDEESIKRAVETVKSHTHSLFAILHYAGLYKLNSFVEIERQELDRILNVNLFGAYSINKVFLPLLSAGSRIVMVTSELAPLQPLPFTGIYAVTKGALDKYAYSLRMELQLLGISVSVLRAGAVKTDMLGASTAELERFCQNTKLYECNAARFKSIVDKVEAKNVAPSVIAKKTLGILQKKKPKFAYSVNRNPYLLILDKMPKAFQFWIIKKVLK